MELAGAVASNAGGCLTLEAAIPLKIHLYGMALGVIAGSYE